MTFRFKNKELRNHDDEGHDDESKIQSRLARLDDDALLEASFCMGPHGCEPLPENHPMRYWATAGWGPVPAVLRAPEGIYRELELINPSDLDQKIELSDAPLWIEKRHHRNIISDERPVAKVGEVRWVAVIDVRDDTTVENFTTPPQGSDAIVCSPEELEAYRPPIDTATGREYIEMTSGEFLVRDVTGLSELSRVGNAAVGKWFWEFHPRRGRNLHPQLIVCHESVDDTAEYKTPYKGPAIHAHYSVSPLSRLFRDGSSEDPNEFELAVKTRNEALAVVETFLWIADAEPQLKHAVDQFMTKDPNLWWQRGKLPDGFLLWGILMPWRGMLIGEPRSEKLCFVKERWLLDSMRRVGQRTILGGCVVRFPNNTKFVVIQFKPSRATGKIVAMRAVFSQR